MSIKSTIKLAPEVIEVLKNSRLDGLTLFLPPGQLETSLYMKVNKAISLIGGKWNRFKKGHVFTEDATKSFAEIIGTGAVVDEKKLYQFYPTPREIVKRLVALAEIESGHWVLEPSAGIGHIVDELQMAERVDVCEIQQKFQDELKKAYRVNVVGADFLEYNPGRIYDRIIANPPFTKRQDVKHVRHMLTMLKAGGRIVSVIMGNLVERTDSPAITLRNKLNERFDWRIEELSERAFAESGTNIETSILIVDA